MRFGDKFRVIRAQGATESRKAIRDMLRGFQLKNNGRQKETRPVTTTKETA